MKRNCKFPLLVMVMIALLGLMIPVTAVANSAEQPSVCIIVNNPPKDLSITMVSVNQQEQEEAEVERAAWEGYYMFYSWDMKADDKYTFRVTTEGESYTCTLDVPLTDYNNIVILDLSSGKFTSSDSPLRSVLLVVIRLLLTLIIEGFIFWLFKYRQKRSWIIFLIINLITQGGLNIWLNDASHLTYYLMLSLFIGEFFVFLIEMIAFPIFIKEQSKVRSIGYAYLSNLVSLIAGGFMITLLPV